MKLTPAIRKQLIPLSRSLPPQGAQVLILVRNELNGDYFVVGEVQRATYYKETRTQTGTMTTATPKLRRGGWPEVVLHDDRRVNGGKYLILAE